MIEFARPPDPRHRPVKPAASPLDMSLSERLLAAVRELTEGQTFEELRARLERDPDAPPIARPDDPAGAETAVAASG